MTEPPRRPEGLFLWSSNSSFGHYMTRCYHYFWSQSLARINMSPFDDPANVSRFINLSSSFKMTEILFSFL